MAKFTAGGGLTTRCRRRRERDAISVEGSGEQEVGIPIPFRLRGTDIMWSCILCVYIIDLFQCNACAIVTCL